MNDTRTHALVTLGTPVSKEASSDAELALKEADLYGWNIRKVPAFCQEYEGRKKIPMTGRNAVIRTYHGQTEYMGDVGDKFQIVQNEQHAEFLNILADESGAKFTTLGATDGGKQVFVSMRVPAALKIGGVDPVDNFLVATNGHDGSMSFTLMVTPVRLACMNALNVATKRASNVFRIRHTSGLSKEGLVQQAREKLELSWEYLDDFNVAAEQMIQTTLTQQRFESIIAKEFGAPKDSAPATITRCDNKIDKMAELFADAETQEGIRGTAWAGFNALTEWYDHYSPVRTKGDDQDARAKKALWDPNFKTDALRLMMAVK